MLLISKAHQKFIFLVFTVLLAGCGSPRKAANDEWQTSLANENFSPFKPPRASNELANIITFDDQGREFLIASASTCFKDLTLPKEPTRVFFLESSSEVNVEGSIAASLARLTSGSVDLDALAKATNTKSISMRLVEPGVSKVEIATLKGAIAKIERSSDCYKFLANPRNLIVVSNLSVKSAAYEFKDAGDAAIKLDAAVLAKGKVSPSLQNKYAGSATLAIDVQASIGYVALAVRELPGLNKDLFDIKELGPKEVEEIRSSMKSK